MRFSPKFAVALAIVALVATVYTKTSEAQVRGISYTLSPTGKYVFFSDDAGLKDGLLYGGELGFGFGKFLELDGVYLLGNGFETDYSTFSEDVLAPEVVDKEDALMALDGLSSRKMDLTRYGGKVRINVGSGRLIPFLTAGTGIQQFKGDGVTSSEQIYSNLGVGLTFSVAQRYTLSVGAENFSYRYNPGSTFLSEEELTAVGLTRESFNMVTVHNPVLSASLKIFLGGRSENGLTDTDRAMLDQLKGGNFRLVIEPFYGQVNFNSALGFPESTALAGVNAGFDLGPYVGIRGFYWRDTEQVTAFKDGIPKGFGKLKMYGGEMNLRFGSGGITPYLIVGAGYLNGEKSDLFENAGGNISGGIVSESRYFATGGAGLLLPLTSSIKLQGGVRGLFMSTEDIENVNGPSSVFGSLMYSAGINFNIGRKPRKASRPSDVRPVPVDASERGDDRPVSEQPSSEDKGVKGDSALDTSADTTRSSENRVRELEMKLDRVLSRLDSLQASPRPMDKVVETDSVIVQGERSNISNRMMTIPVPEVGEIYIRFGASKDRIQVDSSVVRPGGRIDSTFEAVDANQVDSRMMVDSTGAIVQTITPETIKGIVQQVLKEQKNATPAGVTPEQLEKSLRQMEDRLEDRIKAEAQKANESEGPDMHPVQVDVITNPEPMAADSSMSQSKGLVSTWKSRQLNSILPEIGLSLKDGIDHVVIGARADYRFPDQTVRFMPEAALNIGESVGISALANFAWYPYQLSKKVETYAGVGAGLVSEKGLAGLELKLNLFAGIEFTAKTGATFFGEFSTLDFFDYNRLMFGYRMIMDK